MTDLSPEAIPEDKIEQRITDLSVERLVLPMSPVMFDRLYACADHKKMSVEDYVMDLLQQHLSKAIGRPSISAPSVMSGTKQEKTVTGPTYSVTRVK